MTDEVAAAHAGVDLAAPGDLVVVLVDRVTLVWEALAQRAEHEASQPGGRWQRVFQYQRHSAPRNAACPKRPGNAGGAESRVSRKHRATA